MVITETNSKMEDSESYMSTPPFNPFPYFPPRPSVKETVSPKKKRKAKEELLVVDRPSVKETISEKKRKAKEELIVADLNAREDDTDSGEAEGGDDGDDEMEGEAGGDDDGDDEMEGEAEGDDDGDDDGDDGYEEFHFEEEGNRLGVDEEKCEDFGREFAEDGKEVESEEDDSGPEFCDDSKIPDPLSADEDEDNVNDIGGQPEREEEGVYLKLGKTFNSKEDVKIAVLRYSLKSRYDIKLYLSEYNRVGAKCSDKRCPWRMYCSYAARLRKMQVKVFVDEHTCVKTCRTAMLKHKTIAWLFEERLRKNPKLRPREMVQEIQREYGFYVTEHQCSKAKTTLAKERRDNHFQHFDRIWDYQAEVMQSNRNSVFEIETVPGPSIGSKQRFCRLFICFDSQRKAWKETCRPIIGLDGAFLKWDIKGHLLAAVGRDGDNRIVPIAWAVVEVENNINWEWFIRLLAVSLELNDGKKVAIISDKQKGLVNAVHNLLPQAEHRQCARHILENWKRDSHDMELQRLFWKIARSYTQGEFVHSMEALKRYNLQAHLSLIDQHPETWSRAFFRVGTFSVDILNNLSESFNRTIKHARKKPLLDLLEDIRKQTMVRTEKRSNMAGRLMTRFTKKAHAEIDRMTQGAQTCTILSARNNLYEVDVAGNSYRVDMNEFTCGCRKWQLTGIPCIHGTAVILKSKLPLESYVSGYYMASTLRDTYRGGIAPVQGSMMWPRVNRMGVLPPPFRRGTPGRPSNYARKKGRHESATSSSSTTLPRRPRLITCSNCKREGHNKKTCQNEHRESGPKRRQGRPRLNQVVASQGTQGTTWTQGSENTKGTPGLQIIPHV